MIDAKRLRSDDSYAFGRTRLASHRNPRVTTTGNVIRYGSSGDRHFDRSRPRGCSFMPITDHASSLHSLADQSWAHVFPPIMQSY